MPGRKYELTSPVDKLKIEAKRLNFYVGRVIEKGRSVLDIDDPVERSRVYSSTLREVKAAVQLMKNANALYDVLNIKWNESSTSQTGDSAAPVNVKHDVETENSFTPLKREGVICPNIFDPRPGEIYDVFISHVVTPDEIYVHIVSPPYSGMQEMENLMKNYYSHHVLKFETKKVFKKYCKEYCAVLHNKKWVRALILDYLNEDISMVMLFLIDYGIKCNCEFKFIQPLVDYFVEYPEYAVLCKLPVFPPSGEQSWSRECLDALSSALNVYSVYRMTIVAILENDPIPYIMLCCEEGYFQLNVSEYLVLNNYAAPIVHLTRDK